MKCLANHTTYQLTDDEFRCPKCGACPTPRKGDDPCFVILESDPSADLSCERLHDADELNCDCGYATTGKRFSALVAKQKHLVRCPICKGKGVVPDDFR